ATVRYIVAADLIPADNETAFLEQMDVAAVGGGEARMNAPTGVAAQHKRICQPVRRRRAIRAEIYRRDIDNRTIAQSVANWPARGRHIRIVAHRQTHAGEC